MESKTKIVKIGEEWVLMNITYSIEKFKKKCTTCKTPKYLEEFRKLKKCKYGVSHSCKECEKVYFSELHKKKKDGTFEGKQKKKKKELTEQSTTE